jgi:GrpB-like predicted nucleotidyltransferase (UPF0157 family)
VTPTSGLGDHRIVDYDSSWSSRAAVVIDRLRAALGPRARRIEHIGSTSVPGLAARPIPDVQVPVDDVRDHNAFVPALAELGYELFRFPELDVDDYLVFVPADGSNTEHVQVCEAGSQQEHRHLAVRDYLKARPDECDVYEQVKRRAAAAAAGDRAAYSRGKDAHVQGLERRALAWALTAPTAADATPKPPR